MQSTLFTTLTATEEASLSGGHKKKKKTTTTPTTTTPKPTLTLTLTFAPVIKQTAINVNTGDVKGDLTQTAANQIGV